MKKYLFRIIPITLAITGLISVCVILNVSPDRLIGAAFCHQLISRSPHNFPFCWRCCGMFYGILFGGISYWLFPGERKLFTKTTLLLFAISTFVFLTDSVNSASFIPVSWYPESPSGRFITAWPFGFFIGEIVHRIFAFLEPFKKNNLHIIYKIIYFLLCLFLSYLSLFTGVQLFKAMARVLISLSALSFLCILYSILLKALTMLREKSISVQMAIAAGSSVAVIQIILIGSLHIKLVQTGLFPV